MSDDTPSVYFVLCVVYSICHFLCDCLCCCICLCQRHLDMLAGHFRIHPVFTLSYVLRHSPRLGPFIQSLHSGIVSYIYSTYIYSIVYIFIGYIYSGTMSYRLGPFIQSLHSGTVSYIYKHCKVTMIVMV